MAASFMMPGKIISGRGALKAAGELLPAVGKKALIVTDPTMEKLGNLEKVTDILDQKKIAYAVFSGIYGEPDDGMIEVGIKAVEAVFDWKKYQDEIRAEEPDAFAEGATS